MTDKKAQIGGGSVFFNAKDRGGGKHALDVSSPAKVLTFTPTLNTDAYSDGDCLGAVMSAANAVDDSGDEFMLVSVVAIDTAGQKAEIDLVFFNASATGGTNNAAYNPNAAEGAKMTGFVKIQAANYEDMGSLALGVVDGKSILMKLNSTTTLYCQAVTRGTPTYAASSLTFLVGVLPV